MKLSVCTTGKTPSVLKGTYRFQNNLCSHPDDIQGRPSYFRMLNSRVQRLQQHNSSTVEKSSWELPAVQTFHRLKTFVPSWQDRKQERGNRSPAAALLSSQIFTDCCWKQTGRSTVGNVEWETWSQRHVVSTKFKISSYFSLNCTFVQFKHWRVLSVLLHMKHEFVSL